MKVFRALKTDATVSFQPLPSTKWTDAHFNGAIERIFARLDSATDVFGTGAEIDPKKDFSVEAKLRIWGAPGPTYSLADQVLIV